MKKILAMLICSVMIFSLCGCDYAKDIKENLIKAGYTVDEMSESKVASLNATVKYEYGGMGTIISGFYATDKNGNNVFVLEFTDKEDLTVAYKELKAQLTKGQSIDIKGKVIVYGIDEGVKISLE